MVTVVVVLVVVVVKCPPIIEGLSIFMNHSVPVKNVR